MHRLFFAVALVCLAGCQTRIADLAATPASRTNVRYGSFYDQGDHLRELLAAKRITEAAELAETHWAWFEPRLDTQGERLRLLAQEINAREQARLDRAA